MAWGLFFTASMTAPVEVSSWERTQASSVPVMDSKPSRVPEPPSRPTQAMVPASPPSSDQSAILAGEHLGDLLHSQVLHLGAGVDDDRNAVQRHVGALQTGGNLLILQGPEARPMSAVPFLAASMPVPEPVGS